MKDIWLSYEGSVYDENMVDGIQPENTKLISDPIRLGSRANM